MTAEKKKTAAETVQAVMADVASISKTRDGNGFKYRGIDDLINALAEPMRKHGMVIVPHVVEASVVPMPGRSGWAETHLMMEYHVFGEDGTALATPVRVFAQGPSNQGVGAGVAMSYAYKSAISQLLCIPTDDPKMDNEATHVPDPDPVVTREQARQIVALFDQLDGATKDAAKASWKAAWGENPFELPAARFDGAYRAAMDLVEAQS